MSELFKPKFDIQSPYVADYFGVWMMHEETFRGIAKQVSGMNILDHIASSDVASMVDENDHRIYSVDESGIASFVVSGPMMKSVPSMAEGTSYLRLRQQVSTARRDPKVRGAILLMDTPGGGARGNEDAASEIAKFAAEKPIYAFVEDMCCSAGVSMASQATKRFANNATAMYGSMGTYIAIEDMSGRAEQLGIKVHVIKAGEYKGTGTPGTEITESQLAEFQRVVNSYNANYIGLIASGLKRPLSEIQALADGRGIFAADAVTAGLIDGIQSIEATLSQLRGIVSRGSFSMTQPRSDNAMADDKKTPATLGELKKTFPNSTADWRETQLESGNDISQAAIDYANFVEAKANADRVDMEARLEEAKNASAKPASPFSGHQPLTGQNAGGHEDIESGDAVSDFHQAVEARLPKGRTASYAERQNAISYVARTRPALHQAFIAAGNPTQRAKRILSEKYESPAS